LYARNDSIRVKLTQPKARKGVFGFQKRLALRMLLVGFQTFPQYNRSTQETTVWSKAKDEPGTTQYPEPNRGSAPPPAAVPQGPMPVPTHTTMRTVPATPTAAIGPSMRIKGEIHSAEELLVDGDVEGVMESESLLTVGANGKVRANIKAREVVIFGSVHGNVEVTGKIAIREQGSLIGNIKSTGISIDDGAYFKGSIDIMRPEPKVTTKPEKNGPKIVSAAS
jgi:cytoskeletal protein CcmA (bactofilin family)